MEGIKKIFNRIFKRFYKFCFNYLIQLIFSAGFLYQASLLLAEYLSGKTVVSTWVGRLANQPPPAFTLCLPMPWYISLEKTSKIKPEFKEEYSEYIKLLKTFNAGHFNQSVPDQNTSSTLKRIYENVLGKVYKSFYSFPLQEIIKNYTVPIYR